ncbi:MAG TPA: MBL fold metallo-hydrolase [Opitutae bacterium]|jgi:Cft2 family RNA processing exonuclease|nr:MBL fold metallo-hydrolase [Opitutae bacterium]
MKFTDLNAQGGIGANCSLCEMGPFKFVIDSGLHPKFAGSESLPKHQEIERFSLDFIILTHCHLDHLGSLPLLSRQQPDAPVILSYASSILARRMLSNSISVMKRQRTELNIPELPYYGRGDLTSLYDRFKTPPLHTPYRLEKNGEHIELTLHHAGHVAGAVSVSIKYKGKTTFFTGDILFNDQRTLDGANLPKEPVDILVTETTRGSTEIPRNQSRESEIVRMLKTIHSTLAKQGSVLIPVFALGRMQEMLAILDEAFRKKAIPKVPVFCSGLGMDLVNHFHEISKNTNRVRFNRKVLRAIGARPLPKKIEPGRRPPMEGIFLVSSGMMVENTPSYVLASGLLGESKNSILFVGYCDPSTPGGKLLEASRGETFDFDALDVLQKIEAKVSKFDLSGHANRDELIAYAKKISPRAVILHHGDPEAREWFKQNLENEPFSIYDPEPLKTYDI